MIISSTLDRLHSQAKKNKWLWLFSIFNRLALAAGFIPSGIVKIIGERFASGLHANHPMGHYLEALHTTGYYYTFIGVDTVDSGDYAADTADSNARRVSLFSHYFEYLYSDICDTF